MISGPGGASFTTIEQAREYFAMAENPQADAARFVTETLDFSRGAVRRAFQAYQAYRVWELTGESEFGAFSRLFGRSQRTLELWRRREGLVDAERGAKISAGMAAARIGSQTAIASDNNWLTSRLTGEQLSLPYLESYQAAVQQAGEELLEAKRRGRLTHEVAGRARRMATELERLASEIDGEHTPQEERRGIDVLG